MTSGFRKVDGRRARGDRRRAGIVEAVLRVVEQGGVSAVTHRAVAAEAGVPTASITYHYAALDDLVVAALTRAAEDMAARVRDRIESSRIKGRSQAGAVAEVLAEALGPRRGPTMATYELYLLAARRPALRPAARQWLDVLASLGRQPDEVGYRAFLAGLDGILVQGLIDDDPPTAAELLPVVEHLLAPLR
ncbi:TetR/AcrR family transcriptional regulator [Actinokineospora bangkokensis]|uniref:TetR family transcriptional regulator n=1 Tax=Actinokineospora bangkokensis TaxID=1193682 RepID=A0A1Q9LGN8_9PSEU|nr:TetR family transcriptional regulator [Actinokineospora bangkokensis]OLR91208.1 TetR family transcriptional regulator [Actinokineospora bangkokensis]